MTDSVCSAVGIDRVDLRGKLIFIEEEHGSTANFLLNSIISSSLKKNRGISLILFHNTFGHYHNVGMKLGYNLATLREKEQIFVVEPIKCLGTEIHNLIHHSVNTVHAEYTDATIPSREDSSGTSNFFKCKNNLERRIFMLLKNGVDKLLKHHESVIIIVEDLSHLFDLGMNVRDVWYFIRYLRTMMEYEPSLSLCISSHTYRIAAAMAAFDACKPNIISTSLKYISQLVIIVTPLDSGHAKDVSGKMSVRWKMDSVRMKYNWPENFSYLFRLLDRQIKVFAPGDVSPLL